MSDADLAREERRRQAVEATDAAIGQADIHADEAWKEAAAQVIRELASEQETLTPDDVQDRLTRDHPDVHTHNASALGGVMRRAASEGVIENTGEVVCSERPSQHRKQIRVWRSLVCISAPARALTPVERLEAKVAETMTPREVTRRVSLQAGWIKETAPGRYGLTELGERVIAGGD